MRKAAAAVLLLLAWEAVCRAGLVPQVILPAPTAIVAAAVTDWRDFLQGFEVTLVEIAAATALACLAGILLGSLAAQRRLVAAATSPILGALFAVPLITWYPLFMTWFGIGSASKIVYGAVSGFFPVAIGTLTGVRGVDETRLAFGRAIGCSRLQLVTRIALPSALPSIVAGLRIGTGLTVIGVLVSEMLASTDGIGFLISYNRTMFNTGQVYLGIILALLCAVGANLALSRIERHFAPRRSG